MTTDDIPAEKLRSAHDLFFRRVFGNPVHARGVLQRLLPAELAASVEWSTLWLVPGSYVDEVLGASASDLLFAVETRSAGPLLVYMLWEHQSTQDRLIALRLLGYAARCLADYVRSNPSSPQLVPRLVPIVLYQGDRPWVAPRRLSELFEPSPHVHEMVELELIVHELTAEDAEVLAEAQALTALARAALIAMKLVAARVDLAAHAALFARLLGEVRVADGVTGLQPLLEYILHTRGSERELRAIMEATDSRTHFVVQTAYEKLIERSKADGLIEGEARGLAEGKARGLAEGKARGLAEGKADLLLQLVEARFGEASPEVVERIRGAAVTQLDRWARRLLTASSVDELFAD